jgi:hypothetical protein
MQQNMHGHCEIQHPVALCGDAESSSGEDLEYADGESVPPVKRHRFAVRELALRRDGRWLGRRILQ